MKTENKQTENDVPQSLSTAGLERDYIPKGGMCMTCEKCAEDCSKLHFENMPIIGTTATGKVIVKCTEHVRSNVKLTGSL